MFVFLFLYSLFYRLNPGFQNLFPVSNIHSLRFVLSDSPITQQQLMHRIRHYVD